MRDQTRPRQGSLASKPETSSGHRGGGIAVPDFGGLERAIQVEDGDIERGHGFPGARGRRARIDLDEEVADLQPEDQAGQVAQERGAEAPAGEVIEFGLDEEGERQPLIVQLEHDGGGGERGVEEHGGLPASGASAHDGAGEIEGGGSGGQLPDVVGGGVRPFAGGKRQEAERVERQQPGVGAQQVEAFEDQPVDQEEALRLPERRPGVLMQSAGDVGGEQAEEREAAPLVAVRDVEQRGGQRDEHEHAERGDFGDGERDEGEEVGERR